MIFTRSTGLATGRVDLLGRLSTFLSANGWTINNDTTSGSERILNISKVMGANKTIYFNFLTFSTSDPAFHPNVITNNMEIKDGIALRGSTGYSPVGQFNGQQGTTPSAGDMVIVPYGQHYYFFACTNFVVILIESTAGNWQQFMFGSTLTGDTGSAFFSGTIKYDNAASIAYSEPLFWSTQNAWMHNPATLDAVSWCPVRSGDTNNYIKSSHGDNSTTDEFPNYYVGSGIIESARSVFGGLVIMNPINFFVYKSSDLKHHFLANLLDLHIVNFRDLYAAREYSVGVNKYQVFPFGAKPEPFVHGGPSFGLGLAIRIA